MSEQYELTTPADIRTSGGDLTELFAAFVAAQAKIGPAIADKTNSFHKSKYADLDSIIKACRPHFAEQCLAVMQFPFTRTGTVERSYRDEDGLPVYRPVFALDEEGNQVEVDRHPVMESVPVIYVRITTRLIHQSGQWLEQDIETPVAMGKNPAQSVGQATTYLQRYALRAIAGVAPEDEDAQALTDDQLADPFAGQRLSRNQPPARGSRRPQGPARPQGPEAKLKAACDRLRSAENLATLRALYESTVRDFEKNGTEDDLANLEACKDECKEKLQMPADDQGQGKQEQAPADQSTQPQAKDAGIHF